MTQWEYLVARDCVDTDFDVWGKLGWELVTIISRPGLPERAVFKRPVAAPAAKVPAKKGAR